jgi:NitT/TauT family transport system ATP-binding protein
MDEPFGALDAITREAMQEELARIRPATRKTVLFVTHDIEEPLMLADRVMVPAGRPAGLAREVRVTEPFPRRRGAPGLQAVAAVPRHLPAARKVA